MAKRDSTRAQKHASSAANAAGGGQPATLWVVATPIGNLGDLSTRAREILSAVQVVAAEDTRLSGQMLQALHIQAQLVSLHEHNESERIPEILARLGQGESVALVSDAGTPLISDPGYRLVQAAAHAGINVSTVPGPCAAIAALSVAALPSDRFTFEGFLSAKSAARREQLGELATDPRTLIFYEAPHRLRETLIDMSATLGATRRAVIARELTKAFETIYRGSLAQLAEAAAGDANMQRGEIVLIVEGSATPATASDAELRRVVAILLEQLPVSQAADLAAKLTGAKRNAVYRLALELKGGE